MSTRRTNRMSSLLQQELAELLQFEISDPVLTDVGLTEVTITADLKLARVFFMVRKETNHNKMEEIDKGFKRATPYLRRKLGQALKLKFVPELVFEEDKQTDNLNHIYSLLSDVQAVSPR